MFTTRVLLGKDEPLTHVYAKNVAAFVSQESGNRPVLLGLSLKDNSAETMKNVKDMIKACQVCNSSNRTKLSQVLTLYQDEFK
ncbi:hypothetical protein QQF64_025145 [Cirrhinus molitorella]|uniref:Proteasome assembly chaperone 3 n=1 Tax=Cirrhinus molitorella TaxID=172907 RepID=A0ABR3NNZ9_9TELE